MINPPRTARFCWKVQTEELAYRIHFWYHDRRKPRTIPFINIKFVDGAKSSELAQIEENFSTSALYLQPTILIIYGYANQSSKYRTLCSVLSITDETAICLHTLSCPLGPFISSLTSKQIPLQYLRIDSDTIMGTIKAMVALQGTGMICSYLM